MPMALDSSKKQSNDTGVWAPTPNTPGGKGREPPPQARPQQGTHRQEGEGAKGAQGGPHPAGRGTPKGDPNPARRGAPPGDPTRGEREEKESQEQNTN